MNFQMENFYNSTSQDVLSLTGNAAIPAKLIKVFKLLTQKYGTDFSNYKQATVSRRLAKRLTALQLQEIDEYLIYLEENPQELDVLFETMLIGVTSFFRDAEAFEELKKYLRKIIKSKLPQDAIRIWVPGCATGEEAYSIAILLTEILGEKLSGYRIQIFATDIDDNALASARKGVFPAASLQELPLHIKEKYFLKQEQDLQLIKPVRSLVVFLRHDLTSNPPFLKLDLISCRNLLIYFSAALQKHIMPVFYYALNPNGYLFLGKSETTGQDSDLFISLEGNSKIYQRKKGNNQNKVKFSSFKFLKLKMPPVLPAKKDQQDSYSLPELVKETLFASFEYPYVVINEAFCIEEVYGDVRLYLSLQHGSMNANILKMVNNELQIELREIINKSRKDNLLHRSKIRKFELFDQWYYVRLSVRPLIIDADKSNLYLVIFEKHEAEALVNYELAQQIPLDSENIRIRELEQELTITKNQLQAFIEELETTNEELQSLNEELQLANEELQSANEELETSNEVMEAANGEVQQAYTEVQLINAQLEKKDELLRENEANIQALLNNTLQSFILINAAYNVVAFNQEAKDSIKKIRHTELKAGHSFINYILPQHLEKFVQEMSIAIKGQVYSGEQMEETTQGRKIFYRYTFTPVLDKKGNVKVISIGVLDITREKDTYNRALKYQAKLQEQALQHQKTLDASLDVICSFDAEGRFKQVSAAAETVWGYNAEELLGRKFMDFVYAEDHELTVQATAEIKSGVLKTNFENRYKNKDGQIIPMVWSAKWDAAEELMYCVARDASEKKKSEAALKLSEENYRQIFVASPMPMWLYDMETLRFIEVNNAAVRKYGYSAQEFAQMTLKDIRPAEDVDKLLYDIKYNKNEDYEHPDYWRHLKKNGEIIYVELSSHILEYNNKKVKLILSNDITQKLNVDLELHRSKEKITTILESITDGFYTLDKDWRVTYWNAEAARVLRKPKEEILGRCIWDEFEEAVSSVLYQEFYRAVQEQVAVHLQEYYTPLNVWVEISAYPSEQGLSVYFKDITEQKRITELDKLGRKVLAINALPKSTSRQVISKFLLGLENIHPGMHCSFMTLKDNKLYPFVAPSLPKNYLDGIAGIQVGENIGSCGSAAFLKKKVIVTDIASDPKWNNFCRLALDYGLQACWSFPILSSTGKVLGTLAVYYKVPKVPTPAEESSLKSTANILQVMLENKLAEKELLISNERYQYATLATNDAIWDWDLISNKIYWGEGFEKLFGFDPKEGQDDLAFWESRVHPDDKAYIVQSLENAIQNEQKTYWQEEYRFLKSDNTYALVKDRGYVTRNNKKQGIKMVGAMHDITDRKKAEEELRRLSLIAQETVNGVIIMDLTGATTWVNAAFTRIFGYELHEVVGKTPDTYLHGEETDPECTKYIVECIAAQKPCECKLVNYSKSGKKYWIRLHIQPLLNSKGEVEQYFALQTDITKQKEEEEQLRLLESAITNATDAFVIARVSASNPRNLEISYVNPAFSRITGYAQEEVKGKAPDILSGPETSLTEFEKLFTALDNKESTEVELINYKKDGEPFWTQLALLPVPDKSGIYQHWIFILRNITSRKKYEAERELMISELTQSNADLKQFSYITSHNLRAPLSNLLGFINLLELNSIQDPRSRLLIEKFKESTVQLNKIVNDLLEILVIKNNINVKKEKLNLSKAVSEVINSVDGLLKEVGGSYEIDFSQADEVCLNPSYLNSMLLNLFTNSIKYRSPERQLEIKLTTENVKNSTHLHFSDNGLGIDLKRFGDRIFGLYQRFHNHADSKGLGLYITHTQIKAMGGNITVASEVNKGTTFTIQFNKREEYD